MKKSAYWKGVLSGVLLCVLIAGLGLTALAAGRSIQVEDGVSVTINGARFIPRDAKGREVPLFSYNGTIYAPIRAVCEAAGLDVTYVADECTARLTTGDVALAGDPAAGDYLTVERAKELALEHAGVKAADAVFLKARLDWDDGRAEYELEFYSGQTEYDYELDAVTGAVLSYDHELEDYDIHWRPTSGTSGAGGGEEQFIGAEKAKQIALERAPAGARVVKCELDRDDGRYVYEVELRSGKTEYECDIHAITGVILEWDVDYD